MLPQDLEPATTATGGRSDAVEMVARTDIPWLQPLPDRLWEPAADRDEEPDAVAVRRETIELAFIAALQHLPPRRRAVLVLRDVLGWPARQAAEHLGMSEAAVASALHRARSTLRERLPERRADWVPATEPLTAHERAVLDRYVAAVERADLSAVAEMLAEDVRATMPPWTLWFTGRPAVMAALTECPSAESSVTGVVGSSLGWCPGRRTVLSGRRELRDLVQLAGSALGALALAGVGSVDGGVRVSGGGRRGPGCRSAGD